MKNLKLWKIYNDGTKEKTTWDREKHTIEKNYPGQVNNIYQAIQNIYPNESMRISNFSCIKLRIK